MNTTRLFDLLKQLIAIPSVTGDEAAVGHFLADYLTGYGFIVHRQEVAPNRFNLFAAYSPVIYMDKQDLERKAFYVDRQNAQNLEQRAFYPVHPVHPCELFVPVIFCTHIDTVAPFIDFREDEDCIYGRGACDAKGQAAAMIEAALSWKEAGQSGVGLLLVVGEEYDSIGAKRANDWEVAPSRYIVVGEPTDNRLAIGQKGTFLFKLTTQGIAAHSAYPERGESAILKMLAVLTDLSGLQFVPDAYFGETTLNIGLLSGGSKINIIPDRAEAEIIVRLSRPYGEIRHQIEACLADRADMSVISHADPIRLKAVGDLSTTVVSFGSDIPYLTRFGERLLIGPGSIFDAHTAHEKITKTELIQGAENYLKILQELSK